MGFCCSFWEFALVSGNIRLARCADNSALQDLFAQVPMTGNLGLITRRDPDFFALYACQRGLSECWVYEEEENSEAWVRS